MANTSSEYTRPSLAQSLPTKAITSATARATQNLLDTAITIELSLQTWPILQGPLDPLRPRLVPHLGPEHPDYHCVPIRTVTPELRNFLVFAAVFRPFDFGIFPLLAVRTTLQRLHTQLLS